MSQISLSSAIRTNLTSLKQTSSLMEQTTSRLATGKKVSTAVDNPTNFFAAQSYNDRAAGLSARLDGMGEAIQQVKAADNGIGAVKKVLSQMKGVVNDALANADSSARADLGKQFNELVKQAGTLAKDSGYAGINLLQGNQSRTVEFNEKIGGSTLKISGFNVQAAAADTSAAGELDAGTGSHSAFALSFDTDGTDISGIKSYGGADGTVGAHEIDWAAASYNDATGGLATVVSDIEKMEDKLKSQASKLASNLAVITEREDFTNKQIDVLQTGADNLTLADLNEEGANLLALQTASQLSVQSLSLASQQNQQVLRIIG